MGSVHTFTDPGAAPQLGVCVHHLVLGEQGRSQESPLPTGLSPQPMVDRRHQTAHPPRQDALGTQIKVRGRLTPTG